MYQFGYFYEPWIYTVLYRFKFKNSLRQSEAEHEHAKKRQMKIVK